MRISKTEKMLLQQAFEPPVPKKKRTFLRSMPKREADMGTLLLTQAAYIRKWVWVAPAVMFGLAFWTGLTLELEVVWVLSALLPFVAILVITELAKSPVYGMTELEMTARFSMRTMLLARMVLVGAVQLAALLLVTPLTVFADKGTWAAVNGTLLFQNGVYMLVPYLLTAVAGLYVIRKQRGREGMYLCGSISAFVSVLCPLSRLLAPVLYKGENFWCWGLAAVLLAGSFGKEYKQMVKQLEDFV